MKMYNLAFLLLFQLSFPVDQALKMSQSPGLPNGQQKQNEEKAAPANIVFKSSDQGNTWQDVSEGLPDNLPGNQIGRDDFFTGDSGMYIRLGTEVFHNESNSTGPFWKKAISSDEQHGIVHEFLQQINAMKVWSPRGWQLQDIRGVFETARGSIFICYENGIYKSDKRSKSWKQVFTGAWVMKIVESNNILMATSEKGILRSTDDGEKWETVLNEGGVGIAVESIKGGFAAITANTTVMARTISTTYDSGKTWQHIDAGLPADLGTSSIVEVGEYFFCGHPAGIFRSSDKGRTWKLLLPSIENKVFNLYVSGNVIYAIPRNAGC